MKIKKIYQGTIPTNKILNEKTESNTDTYSCDYINSMSMDDLPLGSIIKYNGSEVPDGWQEVSEKTTWEKLYGEIKTQGVFTLANNVYSYDLIIIITSSNDYDHYHYNNVFIAKDNINGLLNKNSRLIYIDTDGSIKTSGYFKMTEYTIDTNGLDKISTARILKIYGVRFRG